MQTLTSRARRRICEHIAALGSEDNDTAIHAENTLIRYYGARPVEMLIDVCSDPNPQMRFRAAWILGKTRDERAIGPLSRLMWDSSTAVRYDATLALGKLGNTGAVDALIQRMCAEDVDGTSDCAAVVSLGEIGASALPALLKLVEEAVDQRVKLRIAVALGYIRDERAITALVNLLQDTDDDVRSACIEGLVNIGTPSCRDTIRSLQFDPSEQVQRLAKLYSTQLETA